MSLGNQRKAPAPAVIDRLLEKLRTGVASVHRVGIELKLSPKQIKFAELYAAGYENYSATECAMKAYGVDRTNGEQMGWQNIHHPCILTLIDIIFVAAGLSTAYVSKELIKALKQDTQPAAKVAAAKLIFELTGRLENRLIIEQDKPVYDYSVLTDEELATYKALTFKLEQTIKTIAVNGRTIEQNGIDNGGGVSEESI